MFLAKVIGNVVSTIKLTNLKGHKLLKVCEIGLDGHLLAQEQIVADNVHAGIGDFVLCTNEAGAAQMILGESVPINATVVGVLDHTPNLEKK